MVYNFKQKIHFMYVAENSLLLVPLNNLYF